MPITSFTNISLSNIFQDLPYLVRSHGLFADICTIGKTDTHLLTMKLNLTQIRDSQGDFLRDSRLLRKMRHLPACESPCTFCTPLRESYPSESQGQDICPMCLKMAVVTWTKEINYVTVMVLHDGTVSVAPDLHTDTLVTFFEPRFVTEIQKFEKNEEMIARVADEMEKKKTAEKLLRKRRFTESEFD